MFSRFIQSNACPKAFVSTRFRAISSRGCLLRQARATCRAPGGHGRSIEANGQELHHERLKELEVSFELVELDGKPRAQMISLKGEV